MDTNDVNNPQNAGSAQQAGQGAVSHRTVQGSYAQRPTAAGRHASSEQAAQAYTSRAVDVPPEVTGSINAVNPYRSAHPKRQQRKANKAGASTGAATYGGVQAQGAQAAREAAKNKYSRANYGVQVTAKKKTRKRRAWTVVFVLATLVLLGALGALGYMGYGYWHGTKTYDDVEQSAEIAKEASALSEMTVNWDALLATNPDTVAWVYVPNTSISYPVVQGANDDEYLHKEFDGNTGGLVNKGSIFLFSDNSADFSDQNCILFGHNMNDNSMFAHLLDMTKQSEFNKARTVYVLTPAMNYKCTTVAIDLVKNTDVQLLQVNFEQENGLQSYISARIGASQVAAVTDVDIASMDKVFTLITCGDDYATTRAVLVAGVVEQAEPASALIFIDEEGIDADADASDAGGDDEE